MNETFHNQSESKEVPQDLVKDVAGSLLKRKGLDIETDRDLVVARIEQIQDRYKEINDTDSALEEVELLKSIGDTLNEAHGNFNGVFDEENISLSDFLDAINDLDIAFVNPLDYSTNVANGMRVEDAQIELSRLPDAVKNAATPQAAALALINYIRAGNHLGVSEEMYTEDLSQGKDHDATMIYLLEHIANGKTLPPVFVAKYAKAAEKFEDESIKKVILDGTHRMFASAATGSQQAVLEIDMDE